jgi:hypothetical protein
MKLDRKGYFITLTKDDLEEMLTIRGLVDGYLLENNSLNINNVEFFDKTTLIVDVSVFQREDA